MKPRHILVALLITFIWGANFVALKGGLREFPPILFTFLRLSCVGIPALAFIRRGETPWKTILVLGFILGVLHYGLLMIGLQLGMTGSLSSLVMQTQAVFTLALSALILKDPPSIYGKTGIAVAMGGLGLIATTMGGSTLAGFVLILGSAFSWAVANIILKRVGRVDMLSLTTWSCVVPLLPLLLLSFVFEENQLYALTHASWKAYAMVGFSGLLATLLCFFLWAGLLQRYSTNTVVPFSLLVPVFGFSLCWFFLGEAMSLSMILGSLVVFVGLAIIVIGERAKLEG